MGLIFISYRLKGADRLQLLLDALKARNVECWLDPRDVKPFTDFIDAVVVRLPMPRQFWRGILTTVRNPVSNIKSEEIKNFEELKRRNAKCHI